MCVTSSEHQNSAKWELQSSDLILQDDAKELFLSCLFVRQFVHLSFHLSAMYSQQACWLLMSSIENLLW